MAVTNQEQAMSAFKMYHPKHGEAQCSPEQWAEFEKLGWSKTAPKAARSEGGDQADDDDDKDGDGKAEKRRRR